MYIQHRTEKDGVVETHIEKRTHVTDDDGGIDYDKVSKLNYNFIVYPL